jgi:L-iditol 2-dehydrogenase
MRALVLHGAGELRYESGWPDPVPVEGSALVCVTASGICGSDLPRVMQTGAYHHPMIPGHEFSGTVAQTLSPSVRVGDRVAVLPIIPCGRCPGCRIGPFHCESYDFIGSRRDGGFAEYCTVPAGNLFPLAETMTDEEAAFIEPLAVTLHVLRRSGMPQGARVLVFGAGGIGILIAQWAKVLGAGEVALTDIRDESLRVAAACGVARALNSSSGDFAKLGGFTHIFEAAGSTAAVLCAIERAEPRATLTIVGREVNDTVIPHALFERLMRKEMDIKGCWGYDLREDSAFLHGHLSAGRFVLEPMISHRINLCEGPEMIAAMWRKSMFYCKAMFTVS